MNYKWKASYSLVFIRVINAYWSEMYLHVFEKLFHIERTHTIRVDEMLIEQSYSIFFGERSLFNCLYWVFSRNFWVKPHQHFSVSQWVWLKWVGTEKCNFIFSKKEEWKQQLKERLGFVSLFFFANLLFFFFFFYAVFSLIAPYSSHPAISTHLLIQSDVVCLLIEQDKIILKCKWMFWRAVCCDFCVMQDTQDKTAMNQLNWSSKVFYFNHNS